MLFLIAGLMSDFDYPDVHTDFVINNPRSRNHGNSAKSSPTSNSTIVHCGGTYIAKGRKIGRNELCPCESGIKYKKCCLKHNL